MWILPANSETSDVDGWELVWSDEFDGEKLDVSKWTYDVDCWGGGNNERQCYTDKEENVKLENGFLKIIALKKRSKGYAVPQIARDGYIPNPTSSKKFEKKRQAYTSGRISTRGKQAWQYGRFEARMKLPMGQGMWPAFSGCCLKSGVMVAGRHLAKLILWRRLIYLHHALNVKSDVKIASMVLCILEVRRQIIFIKAKIFRCQPLWMVFMSIRLSGARAGWIGMWMVSISQP